MKTYNEEKCGGCEHFTSCQKELWVSEFTEQQSVIGCLKGDRNIREEEEPESCECDNTHEANNTVCRWCWARGRRKPSDPEIKEG